MAKKMRPKNAKKQPPEVEILTVGDVCNSIEPVPDEDLAAIKALKTREEVEEYLRIHGWRVGRLCEAHLADRTIIFREVKTGKLFKATSYFLHFVKVDDGDEEDLEVFP